MQFTFILVTLSALYLTLNQETHAAECTVSDHEEDDFSSFDEPSAVSTETNEETNNGSQTTRDSVSLDSDIQSSDHRSSQCSAADIYGTELFYMYRIPGDGNCFFRAIAHCLGDQNQERHVELRHVTHEWCKQHQKYLDLTSNELKEIGTLNFPVGENAITGAANAMQIQINVWYDASDRECQIFRPANGPVTKTVNIFFKLEGHYDALCTEKVGYNPVYERWFLHQKKIYREDEQYARKMQAKNKPNRVMNRGSAPKRRKQAHAFNNLPLVTCQKMILGWLIDQPKINRVLSGDLFIEEEDVEMQPDAIPNQVLDDNVDCGDIRSFFSEDAWIALEQVLAVKSRNAVWTCRECLHKIDDGQISIVCDSCLEWNHLTCVGLRKRPGSAEWFCKACKP